MRKSLLWGGVLLALAVGGPISFFRFGELWKNWRSNTGDSAAASGIGDDPGWVGSGKVLPTGTAAAARLPIEGAPVKQLTDVFRFDVSPSWVLQRWPRVSTDLTPLELRGYRVPLVTGTQMTDLAGALTYNLNPAQQVHRITFIGKTGDPRGLIEMITKYYRFVRRPVNDPGRLVYESLQSTGQSAGQVLIASAPVVRADRPFERYRVELRMERPQ
jgi:hypothetical protein